MQNKDKYLNDEIVRTLNNLNCFSSINASEAENMYNVACVLYKDVKIAFAIKKTAGILIMKGTVKVIGMSDKEMNNLAKEVSDDYAHTKYIISANQITFSGVLPLKNIEENLARRVIEVIFEFIGIVTKASKKLRLGNELVFTIDKNYSEILESDDDMTNSNNEDDIEESNSINNIDNEIVIDKEFEQSQDKYDNKHNEEYKDEHKEVQNQNIVVESVEENNEEEVEEVEVEEGVEGKEETEGKVEEREENEEIQQEEMKQPQEEKEEVDDIPIFISLEDADMIGGPSTPSIEKEEQPLVEDELEEENTNFINSLEKKIEKEKEQIEMTNHVIENEIKSANKAQITPQTKHEINENKEYQNDNNHQKPIESTPNMQKNNDSKEKQQKQEKTKDNKVFSNNNKPLNEEKSIEREEKKMNSQNVLFVNYQKELNDLNARYRQKIKSLDFDELFELIESKYKTIVDNNGNKVNISEDIKNELCDIAKEELKNRCSR